MSNGTGAVASNNTLTKALLGRVEDLNNRDTLIPEEYENAKQAATAAASSPFALSRFESMMKRLEGDDHATLQSADGQQIQAAYNDLVTRARQVVESGGPNQDVILSRLASLQSTWSRTTADGDLGGYSKSETSQVKSQMHRLKQALEKPERLSQIAAQIEQGIASGAIAASENPEGLRALLATLRRAENPSTMAINALAKKVESVATKGTVSTAAGEGLALVQQGRELRDALNDPRFHTERGPHIGVASLSALVDKPELSEVDRATLQSLIRGLSQFRDTVRGNMTPTTDTATG
ncbi:MAG: hypothetical protein ACKVPX_00200 [Myxococcaceae bacterium]